MKNTLLAALLCCISLINYGQTTINWMETPVEINGNDTDWGEMLRFYHSDTRLRYDLRNDNNYLYLVFTTTDEMAQRKLQMLGTTIWLKTKTNPKTTAMLRLPAANTPGAIPGAKPGERPSRAEHRVQFMLNKPNLLAEGFAFTNGPVLANDTNGINYALTWDTANIFTLEIRIALRELGGEFYSVQALGKKNITLQVEYEANERPNNEEGGGMRAGASGKGNGGGGMGGGGGMPGGGMGGMGGGMSNGGMPNGGGGMGGGGMRGGSGGNGNAAYSGERTWLFEPQTLKTKFKLAPGNS